jgi:predicted PurR-regulated permease PerM
MHTTLKFPFYAKLAFILVSISLIIALIHLGQQVLVPIMLALLFAILLRPVVNFLNTKLKFPHVIAVIVSVFLFLVFIVGIIVFVSWQVGDMASDWDQIKSNITTHYHTIQKWVSQHLNISYNQQQKYVDQATKDSLSNGGNLMGNTLTSFTEAFFSLILVPIYMFLFLLYRNLFIKFLTKLVSGREQGTLQEILMNVKVAIQSYIVGLLIEFLIVATLTSIGLMIVGVKYAILLGVITGLLNLIPYIGIMIACGISILASLTSSTDISLIFGVLIVNTSVQLLDNNILIPMIVSSKVKINAFVSIAGVIIGGTIAGVAGMFLSIPVIAILKVIFDRIDALEPWGFLMGDDLPKTYEWGKLRLPSWNAGSHHELNSKNKQESPLGTDSEKKLIKLNLKKIVIPKTT